MFNTTNVLIGTPILEAEGMSPSTQDVALMLQSFDGSARDLIDLLEETVMAWRAAQTANVSKPGIGPAESMS